MMIDEATMVMEKRQRQSGGEWLIAVPTLHKKYVNLALQPSAVRLYHAAMWNLCAIENILYELTVLLGTEWINVNSGKLFKILKMYEMGNKYVSL